MALTIQKVSGGPMATDRVHFTDPCGIIYSFSKSQNVGMHSTGQRVEFRKQNYGRLYGTELSLCTKGVWHIYGKPYNHVSSREHAILCLSTGRHNTEAKECVRCSEDGSDSSRVRIGDDEVGELFESTSTSQGLAEACKFVYNDAKFVNERARNDIVLLSRGITRLNHRARQEFAILGLEFLKLDARAREDTEKIDHGVKKKAARLHHMAMILKDKAQSKLKTVADQHWSDGALEADLRRADFCVRRRAMEDAFMALEFVRNIHDMMVSKMYKLPKKDGRLLLNDMMGLITLEKNGKALDFFPGEVSTDRITALQEAYWSMASALSEADGVDYTDPEELELLVATLIDLDAMDGKSTVSLLAECSSSPDVNTRKALANALAAAPSMWTLGNAGMGALQRLAEDSNPAVAAAASKAIAELKRQWEIEDGDSWIFTMNNQMPTEDGEDTLEDSDEADNPSS